MFNLINFIKTSFKLISLRQEKWNISININIIILMKYFNGNIFKKYTYIL